MEQKEWSMEMRRDMVKRTRGMAVVCPDHGTMRPVCLMEMSMQRIEVPRKGTRPKIEWEPYMRISCAACQRSEVVRVEGFVLYEKQRFRQRVNWSDGD